MPGKKKQVTKAPKKQAKKRIKVIPKPEEAKPAIEPPAAVQ